MKKVWAIFGAIICALFCISLVSKQVAAADQPQKTAASEKQDYRMLITQKCAACHDLKKVCSQIGKADKEKWKKIISGMAAKAQKKNIVISDAEQKGMLEYISPLKDSKSLCKE